MSISAFGVDHGVVSKSFKKLEPKLAHVMRNNPDKLRTMEQKSRFNYAMGRYESGRLGSEAKTPKDVSEAKRMQGMWKPWNDAHMKAAKNIERRKGRKLP